MSVVTAEQIKILRERTGVGLAKCKSALEESHGDIEKAIEQLRKAGIASAVKKEARTTNEGKVEFVQHGDIIAIVEMNAETDFVVNNERFQKFLKEATELLAAKKSTSLEHFLEEKMSGAKSVDEGRKELIAVLGENIVISKAIVIHKKKDCSYGVYSHMKGKILVAVTVEGSSHEEAFAKDIGMHIAAESPDYLVPSEVPADVVAKEEDIARGQLLAMNKPKEVVEKILQGKMKAYYDTVCLMGQKYIKNTDMTIADLVAHHSKEVGKHLKIASFIRLKIGN